MKIAATIQARTGSTRLPNKVLLPILGEPMLARQIERIQRSQLIDEVIVATTTNPNDDVIEDLARRIDVPFFRGSENDVLGRIVETLKCFDVDIHVEFFGDCPLPDPTIVDSMIGMYLKRRDSYDHLTTSMKTTFPPGLEVNVYPSRILYDFESMLSGPEDRDLVGLNIKSRRDHYRVLNIEAPPWYRYPDLHLEVDTAEDFEVVTAIYEALYPSNPYFLLPHIVEFMTRHPELAESNRHVHRRWKVYRQET